MMRSLEKTTLPLPPTTEARLLCDIPVRQAAQGRYSLNDLPQAAGGENRHRPSLWVENQQTQALIKELETEAGIPALVSVKGGNASGTYVCKELVTAYAMWISPPFHLKVIRAYDALMSIGRRLSETQPIAAAKEALRLAMPALRFARAIGLDKNAAAISASQYAHKYTAINVLADFGHTHLTAENQQNRWLTPTELGQRLGMSARQLNRLLAEAGLQTKQGHSWTPTPQAQGCYRLFDTSKRQGSGTPVTQTKWAENVLARVQPMQGLARKPREAVSALTAKKEEGRKHMNLSRFATRAKRPPDGAGTLTAPLRSTP